MLRLDRSLAEEWEGERWRSFGDNFSFTDLPFPRGTFLRSRFSDYFDDWFTETDG
jgi:hypothetical protein